MVGVKVLGSDLATLQAVSGRIAAVLRTVPGAADVFADQAIGQPTLEVKLDPVLCQYSADSAHAASRW